MVGDKIETEDREHVPNMGSYIFSSGIPEKWDLVPLLLLSALHFYF